MFKILFAIVVGLQAWAAFANETVYIQRSVEQGLPRYNLDYQLDPQGEFAAELSGPVNVVRLLSIEADQVEPREVYVFLTRAPFRGDDGKSGVLSCKARVLVKDNSYVGFRPATCAILSWDDEGLSD